MVWAARKWQSTVIFRGIGGGEGAPSYKGSTIIGIDMYKKQKQQQQCFSGGMNEAGKGNENMTGIMVIVAPFLAPPNIEGW